MFGENTPFLALHWRRGLEFLKNPPSKTSAVPVNRAVIETKKVLESRSWNSVYLSTDVEIEKDKEVSEYIANITQSGYRVFSRKDLKIKENTHRYQNTKQYYALIEQSICARADTFVVSFFLLCTSFFSPSLVYVLEQTHL